MKKEKKDSKDGKRTDRRVDKIPKKTKKGKRKDKKKKKKKKKQETAKTVKKAPSNVRAATPKSGGGWLPPRPQGPKKEKEVSLGQTLLYIVQFGHREMAAALEHQQEKKVALAGLEAQLQGYEDEIAERQTKIKALVLSRNEVEEQLADATAVVEKQKALNERSEVAQAQWRQDNSSSYATSSSSESESDADEDEEESMQQSEEN